MTQFDPPEFIEEMTDEELALYFRLLNKEAANISVEINRRKKWWQKWLRPWLK